MGLFDVFTGADETRKAAEAAATATLPFSGEVAGLGGVQFDAEGRTFDVTQAPEQQETAGLLQQAVRQALAGGAGTGATQAGEQLLQQAGGLNLEQRAQQRFDQLNQLQEQGRSERQAALEQRLFRQGRLDSTGGSRQIREAARGEELARGQLAAQSRDVALAEQQGLLGSALQALQVGGGLGAQQLQQGIQAAGARQGALTAPLAVGQFGLGAGQSVGTGQLAAAQLGAQAGQQTAGFSSGLLSGALSRINPGV